MCLLAAGAPQLALLRVRGLELQQLTEACCPAVVQCCSKSLLHRFQIYLSALPALGKDTA